MIELTLAEDIPEIAKSDDTVLWFMIKIVRI